VSRDHLVRDPGERNDVGRDRLERLVEGREDIPDAGDTAVRQNRT
jgi:hypothetical protein